MKKISFLIPAHNEEKIISKTLKNLLRLPHPRYEVLIGLDGCTDGTEEIVKKYVKRNKNFNYFKINSRKGKPAVIDFLMKKAKGDIIVINDADWIFDFKNKNKLSEFFSIFNDSKIGGITESLPVEWGENAPKKGNLWLKMVAYSSYYWMLYQKERFTYYDQKINYIKTPKMFLTNIFRKDLYIPNSSLGDDFERTHNIMKDGKKIVIYGGDMPRMISTYNSIRLKDFFKQKIRTGIARRQVYNFNKIGLFDYYIPVNFYILRKSFKKALNIGLLMLFWILATSIGHFLSKFKSNDTKRGWTLRAERLK